MALDKEKLLKDLQELLEAETNAVAAVNLANVFINYYSNATVMDTKPIITPLDALFLTTLDGKSWIQTLGTTLQTWLLTIVWSSVAFTGPTAPTTGPALDTLLISFNEAALADKSLPPKDPLPDFVDIIHKWSITIPVALINNISAAPTPVVMS